MALTLLPRGSLAQNHWLIAYSTPTGSLDWSVNNGPSQHSSLPLHLERVGGQSTTKAVSITETATQTITLTWVDSYGKPAPNPPSRVSLKVSSIAQWNAEADTFSGTADNGQGDTVTVADYGGNWSAVSTGSHLRRYVPSQGVVTITNTCTQYVHVSAARYAWADVTWGLSVALDDRGVMISSDRDPTYYKAQNGDRVQNTRDPDGTLRGDTVRSDLLDTTIEYSADQYGTWTQNSAYHWYSSRTSIWDSGAFSPSLLPFFDVGYPYLVGVPGATDHIYIHLIDSGDGAQASGNYYMHFHEANENCVTVVDQTSFGQPTVVSPVYLVDQGSGGTHSCTINNTVSVTGSVTSGSTISQEWLALTLSIQVGVTYTSSTTCTDTYDFVVGKYCWLERTPYWRRREGTADVCGIHGYEAGTWTAESAYTQQNPLAEIVDHWRVSDTPPNNG